MSMTMASIIAVIAIGGGFVCGIWCTKDDKKKKRLICKPNAK